MKKYSWIVALLVALSLVVLGCGNGTTNKGGEEDLDNFDFTALTLVTTIAAGGNEDLSTVDVAAGKGWIVGAEFTKVKEAPAGSILRLTITGTTNLNWDTIGVIGIGSMEGSEGNRLDFAPHASGGTYFVTRLTRDIFALNGGAAATNVNVNIWGGHTITKVELGVPKEAAPPADPKADDFNIIGESTQFITDITGIEIEPKFGMSQGAITIWYEGIAPTVYARSQDVPDALGTYRVTFDVAAATGWNAATGLAAGTLSIQDTPPFFWDNILKDIGAITPDGSNVNQGGWTGGFSADELKDSKYIVLETITPATPDNADGFGGITFVINAAPGWSAGQNSNVNGDFTPIPRAAGETFYIVINLEAMDGFDGITNWAQLFIQYYGGDGLAALGIVKGYLVDKDMPLPAGRVNFTTATNGFFLKVN